MNLCNIAPTSFYDIRVGIYIQQGRKFIGNSARRLSQEFYKYCFRYTLFMDFISLNNLTTL